MRERTEEDHHLCVIVVVGVVAYDRRLDVMLRELTQELEPDVGDDLDVYPGMVVDLHSRHRVHVRGVPPSLQLGVFVHSFEQLAQLAIAAHRDVDLHLRNRFGGSEPGLALGLLRNRLFDPLFGLLVEGHDRILRPRRPAADQEELELRIAVLLVLVPNGLPAGLLLGQERPIRIGEPVVDDAQGVSGVRRGDGARDAEACPESEVRVRRSEDLHEK